MTLAAGSSAFFKPGDAASLVQAVLDRDQLSAPVEPNLADAEQAAELLLRAYASVDRGAAPNRAFAISDRQRAHMLFRRLERRTWTALNAAEAPPVPPGDWIDQEPMAE